MGHLLKTRSPHAIPMANKKQILFSPHVRLGCPVLVLHGFLKGLLGGNHDERIVAACMTQIKYWWPGALRLSSNSAHSRQPSLRLRNSPRGPFAFSPVFVTIRGARAPSRVTERQNRQRRQESLSTGCLSNSLFVTSPFAKERKMAFNSSSWVPSYVRSNKVDHTRLGNSEGSPARRPGRVGSRLRTKHIKRTGPSYLLSG